MVQDESDSVILVVCHPSLVGMLLQQLRSPVERNATISSVAHGTDAPSHPIDAGLRVADGERVVELLRARHGLTDMQCVVLALRFRGLANAEVSDAVGIEVCTVKAHVHAALQRMGVGGRARLDALYRRTVRELENTKGSTEGWEDTAWHGTLRKALRCIHAQGNSQPTMKDHPPDFHPPVEHAHPEST